jgi:two-component system chemotaxis sensor kinase CheA
MEQLLLGLDAASASDEALNAVFRCAHSVKGGAATFGFADVAELTHQMETLLDKLRRRELAPSEAMVDALLQAGDLLRAQLARHRGDALAGDDADTDAAALLARLRLLAQPPAVTPTPAAAPAAPGRRRLMLTLDVQADAGARDALVALFEEITDLGRIEPLPAGADGERRFALHTACSDDELLDLCAFQVDRALLRLAPLPDAPPAVAPSPAPALSSTAAPSAGEPGAPRVPTTEGATLRVPVAKVDQLVNLVGELVITQSMLAQSCTSLDTPAQMRLAAGLAELQRHTRQLQDSVMSIRMVPMSVVFSRFPRMLRDLGARMGKRIELVTHGEATELDKGMIEKITDPLTHLVRNACDHGIETPAERLASGKPEAGTLTLAASHQGGSVLIEVRDDGRGMSRRTLLAKARERGLHAPDSLSDVEVWSLIFAPGFSTAAQVTEVSGRGVGMDVVKRNIDALGGAVEIDAAEGQGMCVRVRLPLTLAIMDGMSVRVADECYVLPLASVVESLPFLPGHLKTVGGSAQLLRVRDDWLPVLELRRVFGVRRAEGADAEQPVMVVVEAGGVRVALRVDELLGQQQVVVKNLEANCGPVAHASGATIMGDGRVALIVDVAALVRRASS